MSFLDNELVVSDGQEISASGLSENVVPLPQNFGKGEPMALVLNVLEAFVGDGVMTISVQHDDNLVFSSATTLITSGSYEADDLAAGVQIVLPIPPTDIPDEDYGGAYYTLASGSFTAGKVQAQFTPLSCVNTAP